MRIYDRLDKVILRAIKADGKMSADNSTIRGKVTNVVNQLLRKRWTGLEIRKPVTSLYSYIYNTVMREMHKQLKSKPVKTTTADEPTTGELVITGLNPTIGTLKHNGKKVTVIHLQDVVFGQTYEYTRTRNIYVVTPAKTGIGRNKTDEDSNLEAYVSRVAGYIRTAYSIGNVESGDIFKAEDTKFVAEHKATTQLDKDTWGSILTHDNKTYWIESDISAAQVDLDNCYKVDFTDFITPYAEWEEPYVYDMREYFDLDPDTWEEQDILLGAESLFTRTFQLRGERRKKEIFKVIPVEHLRVMLWLTMIRYENLYDLDYNGYAGSFSELAIVDLVILNTLDSTYKVYEAEREPWINLRAISGTVIGYTDVKKDVITDELIVLSTNGKTKEVKFSLDILTHIGTKRILKDPPDEEYPYSFEPYSHLFTKEYTLPNLGYELYKFKIDSDLNIIKTQLISESYPNLITRCLNTDTNGIYTFYGFSQQEITGKFFILQTCRLYNLRPEGSSPSGSLLVGGAFECLDLGSNTVIASGFCEGQSYSKAVTYGPFALGCSMPHATYGDNVHYEIVPHLYWATKINPEEFERYLSKSSQSILYYGEGWGGVFHEMNMKYLLSSSGYDWNTIFKLEEMLGKSIRAEDQGFAREQSIFSVFDTPKGYATVINAGVLVLSESRIGGFNIEAPIFHFSHEEYSSLVFTKLSINIDIPYTSSYSQGYWEDFPYGWIKTVYKISIPNWSVIQLDNKNMLLQAVPYYLNCTNTPDGIIDIEEGNSLLLVHLGYTDKITDSKFLTDQTIGVVQHQTITSPEPKELQSYLFKFRE